MLLLLSHSVMSNSVRPHRQQPTRFPRPWESPGKNTEVGCRFLLQCMKVKSESEVTQSCPTLSDPMDLAHQAPPSMGFSRQEYWSGVPLPFPPLGIEEVNSSLYADDMILYIENLKRFHTINRTNKFSKVARYKINTESLLQFLTLTMKHQRIKKIKSCLKSHSKKRNLEINLKRWKTCMLITIKQW